MGRLPFPKLVCAIVWLLVLMSWTAWRSSPLAYGGLWDNFRTGIVEGTIIIRWREMGGRFPQWWWRANSGQLWPQWWSSPLDPQSSEAGGFGVAFPLWIVLAVLLVILGYMGYRFARSFLLARQDRRRGFEPIMRAPAGMQPRADEL